LPKATRVNYVMFVHSDDEIGLLELSRIELAPTASSMGRPSSSTLTAQSLSKACLPGFPKVSFSISVILHPNAITLDGYCEASIDAAKYGLAADMWQINAFPRTK